MALETQLLGISRPELLESTAQVLKNMGRKRAIVVAGPEGLDEAGLNGTTKIALLENGENHLVKLHSRGFGDGALCYRRYSWRQCSGKCRNFAQRYLK